MKSKVLIVFLFLSIVITLVTILLEIPTNTPYSVFNIGDNGYSYVYEKLSLVPVINVSSIDLSSPNDTVVVIPLEHELNNATARFLYDFILKGGMVILLDKNGYSNDFLEEVLGLQIGVVNTTIYDDVFNYEGYRSIPLIRVYFNDENYTCYFFEPSLIDIEVVSNNVSVLGWSSPYSLQDNDGNKYFNVGDSIGSAPVVVYVRFGSGVLVVFSDPDFLSNKFIVIGDNFRFLDSLIHSRGKRYILLSAINASLHDYLKAYVYGFQFRREYWVRILSEFVVLSLILVLFYYGERSGFVK